MEQRMGNWVEAERIYRQLLKSKYKAKEIEEHLTVIQKTREMEKNQARWKTWVDDQPEQPDIEEDE
jgi:hypothetical protein